MPAKGSPRPLGGVRALTGAARGAGTGTAP